MMETSNQVPWVLFAAVVAATASIVGVVLNVRNMTRTHAREISLRLAEHEKAEIEKIREVAAEYIGWVTLYTDYKEDDSHANEFTSIHRSMMTKINELYLLVNQAEGDRISEWHADMISHCANSEFSKVNDAITYFGDMILEMLKPRIAKFKELLNGNTQ
jgi:hypothetical protein